MPTEARKRRALAWALVSLLLALGAAGGVAADRLLLRERPPPVHRGPPQPDVVVRRMTQELELSEAQARAVSGVVETRYRALAALFERVDPEAQAIRKEADDRIREVLDPRQRERFDAQVAERERRREEIRERLGRSAAAAP
jgi:uncharacterized protein YPO0396